MGPAFQALARTFFGAAERFLTLLQLKCEKVASDYLKLAAIES